MSLWTPTSLLGGLFTILSIIGIRDVHGALSGWSSSPTQYHVQNDEGPDRFFRYQTFNGQYRKERRMDDGTVIGSYGWVDPTGYLRMTDYIADQKGYRVLKSRTQFVGVKPEAESGEKPYKPIKHSTRVIRQRKNKAFARAPQATSPPTTTLAPTAPPTPQTSKATTPREQNVKGQNQANFQPTAPKSLHVKFKPQRGRIPKRKIIKVYTRRKSSRGSTSTQVPIKIPPTPEFMGSRPYIIQVTRSLENGEGNDVFKGYATPLRNGNGFLYKIPNQYHKEETEADGSRVGSYGYVDPFGIRRVIHYNAGNSGFAHEIDFKYVGKGNREKQ